MGLLLGAALTPWAAQASVPVALVTEAAAASAPAQVDSRPTKAHAALNAGIEMQHRGEYTNAAAMFTEALARQADLTPAELQDLKERMAANATALKARQEGDSQYQQAEQAYKAGRTSQAEELLKKVMNNSCVSAETRKKATQLTSQIRPRGGDTPEAKGNLLTLARAKVQQARAMINRVDFDGAEQLALEAQKLNAPFTAAEDTPQKVLADVVQLRNDPKALLAGARAACERGDYDKAEKYAHMVEQKESLWTFHVRGDSPAKVLRDCQNARAKLTQTSSHPAVVTPKAADSPSSARTGDGASGPVVAQKTGDAPSATKDSVVTPAHYETTPKPATPVAAATPAPAKTQTSQPAATVDDVPAMLQEAKRLLAEGKLDEAAKVAQRAKVAQSSRPAGWSASWQLFEDTPEKLIKEIDKARHQRDQEESVKVLIEGRKLLEKGDLEGASRCAYKAEKLHGPYSIMDLGDRPHKLLADVQVAQEKRRKSGMPTMPGATATAKAEGNTSVPPVASNSTPTPPSTGAMPPLPGASAYGAKMPGAGADTGSPLAQMTPPSPAPAASSVTTTQLVKPTTAAIDPIKHRAQALLSDSRQFQREGKLIEARQKALECQRLNAVYGPEEDRPEQALVQLASLAGKRIESLMGEAEDCAATAAGDASRLAKAEANLVQARELAVGFGLDTFRIDAKLGQMRQTIAKARGGAVVPLTPPPSAYQPTNVGQATATDAAAMPAPPAGVGVDMLQRARLELRSGHTEVARRLAEEAYRGNYGVKSEAEAVLRDIDREEANQSMLTATRTFDAGQQAFNRHDYAQAAAIFRTIDPRTLDQSRQARLKEIMTIPEMQPRSVRQAGAVGVTPMAPGVGQASDTAAMPQGSPSPEASFATQVQALRDVRFQEMRTRQLAARRLATDLAKAGDFASALDALEEFLGNMTLQVGGGQMDPDQLALLRRPIEADLERLKTLKAQHEFETEQSASREAIAHNRTKQELDHMARQKQLDELMKRYNDLYGQAKFDDAEVLALQMHDLDPENPIVTAAVTMVRMRRNKGESDEIKEEKAKQWLGQANDVEHVGPNVTTRNPISIDKEVMARAAKRQDINNILIGKKSRAEQEIERHLNGHVSINFVDQPLKKVLEDLQTWHGINIVPDKQALDEGLISLDQPISMRLDDVSLKSALNLILADAKLTYVVKDEVVSVTTEKHAKGKLIQKVYQVTDLVTPIQNANMPTGTDLPMGTRASQMQSGTAGSAGSGVQPYAPPFGLNSGQPVGSNSPGLSSGSLADSLGRPQHTERVEKSMGRDTIEDALMSMIKNTIAPSSWSDSGGQATIEFWPLVGALVVNQTPDIQEQIQDLLSALRRLQDQEVAVEVRFITVAESFYERIGIDFNINIRTKNERFEPLLTTGQFQTDQQINAFRPDRFISGLTPAGTFTSDLNIPIHTSSFPLAIPPFGAFQALPGGNGGIDLGLAFLSDIQVFLFMEAAQADQRTHVMQAPKLTLFNGQTAMIRVLDAQFFTSDVSTLIIGTQIAFAPVNTLFPTGGVTLFIRAAISGDRRFVRMDLTPTLTNLATAVVPLIPVVTPIFPATFEGGQVQNPVIFTQFIQQPAFNTVAIMTTVACPDGGTVLMGGLKRLSEGRNEFGPPVLSKIPYLNRLFKNVGYGREVESLMLMVTPRIIIQEEEEERATGYIRQSVGGGF
jgi:type II secretory pathway component GspD/PulD (secretin)